MLQVTYYQNATLHATTRGFEDGFDKHETVKYGQVRVLQANKK